METLGESFEASQSWSAIESHLRLMYATIRQINSVVIPRQEG